MDLVKDIEQLILDTLKKTIPVAAKQAGKGEQFIDKSTKALGFNKITKSGYTPWANILISMNLIILFLLH